MAFDLDNLEYLALEGGGGRGILYLEPIRVLEERLKTKIEQSVLSYRGKPILNPEFRSTPIRSSLPLFQIDLPPEYKVLKGISGSSAGAITAYMLSLGMSSFDIEHEMNRMDVMTRESSFPGPISVFEQFVDEKPNNKYRAVENGEVKLNSFENVADSFFRNAKILYQFTFFVNPLSPLFGETSKYGIYRLLKNYLKANSNFGMYERIFENNADTDAFISNFLGERGFFSGNRIREYFVYLMETYLFAKLDSNTVAPLVNTESITFREFFDLTGVDLVLTGTNITQAQPRIFSLFFTPDFPVIEAVQISMNLPPAFKPTFVDSEVAKGFDERNKRYFGLYVDGGVLNNYPIRSFDNLIQYKDTPGYLSGLTYRSEELSSSTILAGDPFEARKNCDCFLGIRLEETTAPAKPVEKKDLFPTDKWAIADYLKSLYKSFFYPSEEGQIRSAEDLRRTVKLSASGGIDVSQEGIEALSDSGYFDDVKDGDDKIYTIPVEDFATPAIEKNRGSKRLGHYKMKIALIREARVAIEDFLDK